MPSPGTPSNRRSMHLLYIFARFPGQNVQQLLLRSRGVTASERKTALSPPRRSAEPTEEQFGGWSQLPRPEGARALPSAPTLVPTGAPPRGADPACLENRLGSHAAPKVARRVSRRVTSRRGPRPIRVSWRAFAPSHSLTRQSTTPTICLAVLISIDAGGNHGHEEEGRKEAKDRQEEDHEEKAREEIALFAGDACGPTPSRAVCFSAPG